MIALTGGKTGGHIVPLLALAKELDSVCYVGAKNSLEERLCKNKNIEFIGLNLQKNNFFAILSAYRQLKLEHISAIVSTGGYVSVPLLLYGIRHKIPIYLLEENVIMGRTNYFFSLFAKKVFLVYELPKMKQKYEVVGLPLTKKTQPLMHHFDFDILIIGGSLGSKPLCELSKQLNKNYRICLIAGKYEADYKNISNVTVLSYADDLIELMKRAKLVISRAGAATTYEIFTYQRPCILVPSKKTKQNHQYLNALYFEESGCCKLLKEDEAKNRILSLTNQILSDSQMVHNMQMAQQRLVEKDSISKIIEQIQEKKQ